MAYKQKDEFDWPKGWYAVPRGFNDLYNIIWCTGHRYQGYGSAGGRAESVTFDYRHGPYIDDTWLEELSPATAEQISDALHNHIDPYYEAEIHSLEEKIRELKKDWEKWRLRADRDEWNRIAQEDEVGNLPRVAVTLDPEDETG